jgi:hypothetical protein
MKYFWKYYICNKDFWLIIATIIGMLFGIVIAIFGAICIVLGFSTILEEIKILNENIYVGIVFSILGYAVYIVGSYIIKFISKVSENYP